MKKSQLKQMIREAILEDVNGLDPTTKQEIDLMIEMGKELLKFQEGKYEYSIKPQAELKKKLLALSNSSEYVAGYGSAFEEFVDNNLGVNFMRDALPNQSSGSFLNALIDLDGLLYTMGYEDNKYNEEQYDAATEYYESRRRELF